jgi:hypothetical protein
MWRVRSSSLTSWPDSSSANDPPAFAHVTLVLSTVAVAASYIPALRAMRVDPTTTLPSD